MIYLEESIDAVCTMHESMMQQTHIAHMWYQGLQLMTKAIPEDSRSCSEENGQQADGRLYHC
jgi:hypothetical protein